jgi:hypothetical protein
MFDPDPDPDSDPEKTFEKHQTLKLMALVVHYQLAARMVPMVPAPRSYSGRQYCSTMK